VLHLLPLLLAPVQDRAATPDALVDLATSAGAGLVGAEWRSLPARIVEVDFHEVGPDKKPSGPPNRTFDVAPRAGVTGFDDSAWPVVAPESLEQRRGSGLHCAVWYRLALTLPEEVGGFPVAGSTAVLELVVDDYAEVWVDGRLPAALGQAGGPLVAGWNAPNRVVLGRDLQPGRVFEVALLGINGPLSALPSNYVWIRSATLELYAAGRCGEPESLPLAVERRSAALDRIVPPLARIERLADGFRFTEGPVWHPDGYLLFSDPNANTIYRWTPDLGVSIWRPKSGYRGVDVARYRQPGSNGLALDAEGRVVICEHGNRRVTRMERNGTLSVLADRFEGKRLNSPNDVLVAPDGALYFTDPPFGLPGLHDDPARELDVCGVYRLKDGRLTCLDDTLLGPNGIALAPDGRALYVGNWDPERKVVVRYPISPAGEVGPGSVLFDMTSAAGEEAIDGIEVHPTGALFVSGPGGTWVLSPEGEHLGTLRGPELAANFALAGDWLYLAARTGLYRVKLASPGS